MTDPTPTGTAGLVWNGYGEARTPFASIYIVWKVINGQWRATLGPYFIGEFYPDEAAARAACERDFVARMAEAGFVRAAGVLAEIEKWRKPSHVRLCAGEMTAQEMRSVQAALGAIVRALTTPAGERDLVEGVRR